MSRIVDNPGMTRGGLWDIFCKVVDNYGDLGVSWRLSRNLTALGQRVRLWVDEPDALQWMAPHGCAGVQVRHWKAALQLDGLAPGDVLLEMFGCQAAPEFIARFQSWQGGKGQQLPWINLEYLSAEGYVERSHRLPSPVLQGPGMGLTRHFFYPGFTARTGGLLREPELAQRQSRFDSSAWLKGLGLPTDAARRVSLFCYEPPHLAALLRELRAGPGPTQLLVTAGRATQAVRGALEEISTDDHKNLLSISYLPWLSQEDYDHLLWACDLNFVRGEDSLVRALWAGRPLIWQLYPQDDGAHAAKLEAFLELMEAPEPMRRFMRAWNGLATATPLGDASDWQQAVQSLRARTQAQPDLARQLLDFAASVRCRAAPKSH